MPSVIGRDRHAEVGVLGTTPDDREVADELGSVVLGQEPRSAVFLVGRPAPGLPALGRPLDRRLHADPQAFRGHRRVQGTDRIEIGRTTPSDAEPETGCLLSHSPSLPPDARTATDAPGAVAIRTPGRDRVRRSPVPTGSAAGQIQLPCLTLTGPFVWGCAGGAWVVHVSGKPVGTRRSTDPGD